ncbi:hypothetical protein HY837_04970 [archaeon]|nr:hypothetical protein [archaeon]
MSIKEVYFEDLLKQEGEKSYTVKDKNNSRNSKLIAKVVDGDDTYVSERPIYLKWPHPSYAIKFDEEGLPYRAVKYGNRDEFKYYDSGFLGNTCFAEAMGNAHEGRIEELYDLLNGTEAKKIYRKTLNTIIRRVKSKKQKYIDATLKASFSDNQEELLEFSNEELRIFGALYGYELLNGKIWNRQLKFYSKSSTDQEYSEWSLPKGFLDKPRRTDSAAFFKIAYTIFLRNKGYRKKVEEAEKKNEKEYNDFFKSQVRNLEERGFKQVQDIF